MVRGGKTYRKRGGKSGSGGGGKRYGGNGRDHQGWEANTTTWEVEEREGEEPNTIRNLSNQREENDDDEDGKQATRRNQPPRYPRQHPNMGRMPTSSSSSEEDEEEEEETEKRKRPVPGKDVAAFPGQLPPSETETETESESEQEEEKEDVVSNAQKNKGTVPRNTSAFASPKEKGVETRAKPNRVPSNDTSETIQRSRALMKKEMERLKLIRQEREKQAKERIEKDGFDRYAPPEKGGRPNLLG